MKRLSLGLTGLVLALAAFATPARSQCVECSITFTQVEYDSFVVSYAFDEPIYSLRFGPPIEKYRTEAWRVLTPGLAVQLQGTDEVLSEQTGEGFRRVQVGVSPYSAYPSDQYVPMAHFSDGAHALYIGHFLGDAQTGDGKRTLCPRYFFSTPPGQSLLTGSQAREAPRGFVYFGTQKPVDAGYARLLLDLSAPAWIDSTLRTVLSATSELYRRGLPISPKRSPLVLVAAAELESIEGYSIKGGAVGDQIVFTLRGTDLLNGTPGLRATFERLVAHELAHLWEQSADPEGSIEDDRLIREGGCEALAVRALMAGGLWTPQQGASFTARAREGCPQHEMGIPAQPELLREIKNLDPYACGYLMFVDSGIDPFTIWAQMMTRVQKTHEGYTRKLFDEVTGANR